MLGMHGTVFANFAVDQSDLLLAFGVRFDDRVTGKLETFAANAKIVHIDIDPAELNKNKESFITVTGMLLGHFQPHATIYVIFHLTENMSDCRYTALLATISLFLQKQDVYVKITLDWRRVTTVFSFSRSILNMHLWGWCLSLQMLET